MDSNLIGKVCKVYRVQNENGDGPYRNGGHKGVLDHHFFGYSHPTPSNDIGISRNPNPSEQCGFESMEDLHAWFSENELNGLHDLGFEIVIVEGLVTAVGDCQLLFERVDSQEAA